jgi:hypothetical protein
VTAKGVITKPKLTLLLGLSLLVRASADVLPPDAVVGGMTIGEWSAEWHQWAFSCPTNANPLTDTTGFNAFNCQPGGPVFFLAGVPFGSAAPVTRSIPIPEGKYLFFPVLSAYAGDPGDPPSVEERREALANLLTQVGGLHASIDSVPVPNLEDHRATSPAFDFEFFSADNIASLKYGSGVSNLVEDLVADGFYLMVEPLPAGEHAIRFGGSIGPPFNHSIDVTYHLTVVPTPDTVEVVPAGSMVAGRTLEEWSARWWQWQLGLPTDLSPIIDRTGALAHQGQSGAVFFIGGGVTTGSEPRAPPIGRRVTITADLHLFFPIINWTGENVGRDVPLSAQEWRDVVVSFVSNVDSVLANLDGVEISTNEMLRILAPVFSYEVPTEKNIFQFFNLDFPGGVVTPAVSDGIWLMLKPLPVGQHVLQFYGSSDPLQGTVFFVTYLLTVRDPTLAEKVNVLMGRVREERLPAALTQSFVALLDSSKAQFDAGAWRQGIRTLTTFQRRLRLDLDLADPELVGQLTQEAQVIMDLAQTAEEP